MLEDHVVSTRDMVNYEK